jgi:hypothetical protein
MTRLRRFARRLRSLFSAMLISLYLILGISILFGVDSRQIHGLIHIGIAICHALA